MVMASSPTSPSLFYPGLRRVSSPRHHQLGELSLLSPSSDRRPATQLTVAAAAPAPPTYLQEEEEAAVVVHGGKNNAVLLVLRPRGGGAPLRRPAPPPREGRGGVVVHAVARDAPPRPGSGPKTN
ncbi:hypothetical protein E2562_000396 [Oryza meyeriana var. granulata]|uniref:Uncharacterized protein n=1 Tax=Oryza meyeriana var. granulata TaxID=110450 RepID=A0A6G1CB37_9ORYZ|nr:hypothetical protein E2562_000396 [Oryza meyeriana var. granulata]